MYPLFYYVQSTFFFQNVSNLNFGNVSYLNVRNLTNIYCESIWTENRLQYEESSMSTMTSAKVGQPSREMTGHWTHCILSNVGSSTLHVTHCIFYIASYTFLLEGEGGKGVEGDHWGWNTYCATLILHLYLAYWMLHI